MTNCPECGFDGLHGPTHDDHRWSCPDCGWIDHSEPFHRVMLQVSKEFRFEAAHALPHLPDGHKCRNLHGHSYRFEVFCDGPLDARGFVVDYAEIKDALQPLVGEWDHAYLAGPNDPYEDGVRAAGGRVVNLAYPTTAEFLAQKVACHAIRAGLPVSRVVFYETCSSSVVYEP